MAKRRARRLPDVLTADECHRLFKAPNQKCPTGQRNFLMLKMMGNSGLRVSELATLEMRNVNLRTGIIKVLGKGQKDRLLSLNPEVQQLMTAWMETRKKLADPVGAVFVTLKGGPVSTRYVRYMVARYAKRAGIEKKVYPHLLRHTFGTALYRKTRDLMLVRDTLGHAHIGTTQIYTHLANHEVEAALRTFDVEAAL